MINLTNIEYDTYRVGHGGRGGFRRGAEDVQTVNQNLEIDRELNTI